MSVTTTLRKFCPKCERERYGTHEDHPRDNRRNNRAFANPCLYCGTDDNDVPYEDTEGHRDSSQHQWTVYNS